MTYFPYTKATRAVNKSLAEAGKVTRISFNSDWREWRVSYLNGHGVKTFALCDSFTEAVEAAIQISGWTR